MCWLGIELVNPFNSASNLEASFNASRIFGVFLTYLKSVLYFSIFKKGKIIKKVPEEELYDEFIKELNKTIREYKEQNKWEYPNCLIELSRRIQLI